jgi:hypothetical protein
MTKEQFLKLPTNKKTVEILYNEFQLRLKKDDPAAIVFNEIATHLRDWVYLRKCVKSITTMPTVEDIYNKIIEFKNMGYRKQTVLPY